MGGVITDRVEVLTGELVYKSESNGKRNLVIVVVPSLIVGIIMEFLANFFFRNERKVEIRDCN